MTGAIVASTVSVIGAAALLTVSVTGRDGGVDGVGEGATWRRGCP